MSNIIGNLDWSILTDVLLRIVPALLCITIHELSHGYVAYRLGDGTAKRMGRLTLNPLRHIDVVGLLMMAVFRFGWAKPVPVDKRNFENPKRGMALTAVAGPVSNFLLASILLAIYGFVCALTLNNTGAGWRTGTELLINAAWLSVALGVFNLIPIPPLDGAKVLFSFLSDELYEKLLRVERFGMIILMLIIWSGQLSNTLANATSWVFDKLFSISEAVYKLILPVVR